MSGLEACPGQPDAQEGANDQVEENLIGKAPGNGEDGVLAEGHLDKGQIDGPGGEVGGKIMRRMIRLRKQLSLLEELGEEGDADGQGDCNEVGGVDASESIHKITSDGSVSCDAVPCGARDAVSGNDEKHDDPELTEETEGVEGVVRQFRLAVVEVGKAGVDHYHPERRCASPSIQKQERRDERKQR